MDAKIAKLALKLGDEALAAKLVKAGIDNPAKIRAASIQELDAAVGQVARKRLRG